MQFCVRAAWTDGRAGAGTRALSATDILANPGSDIPIDFDDYPTVIDVHASDGTDFIMVRDYQLAPCPEHSDYLTYIADHIYNSMQIKRENIVFTANAVIDADTNGNQDELTGVADYSNIKERSHMLLNLHHTKALIRFAFRLSDRYDQIRKIRITGIELNGHPCILVDQLLTTTSQYLAYCYIDPEVLSIAESTNEVKCTYNIYDKDDTALDHPTREGIVARNRFSFDQLKDASSQSITVIKPGYYYDLLITLDPDYLYVLSDHDNKHIIVN